MPLPVLIVLDDTWYKKVIHGPVCVYHPGDGYYKHVCSIKLVFRRHGIQPQVAVIFWVTGKIIMDFEKQS